MRPRLHSSSSLPVTLTTLASRSSFSLAAASIIPLLLAAAGCAADTQPANDAEGAVGAVEQATSAPVTVPSATPGQVIPLTFVQNNLWQTNQVDNGFGFWTPGQSFFFRGFGSGRLSIYNLAKEQPLRVTQNLNGAPQDVFAIFNDGKWFVDTNADQMHEADDGIYSFGMAGDVPVSGNWSATGIGVFRGGQWYLDTNGDGTWSAGDEVKYFGSPGDLPIVGDWNGDGRSKIGVFNNGNWYLDMNGDGAWDGGDVTHGFGSAGDVPVAGAWSPGTKVDTIGTYNKSGAWSLDADGNGMWFIGDAKVNYFGASAAPVVGHWNSSTRGFFVGCGMYFCSQDLPASLRDPLSVTLRNSVTDPNSVETISYETEYLASVEYLCPNATAAHPCPTTLALEAGGASAPLTASSLSPAAHALSVVGSSPLRVSDLKPAGAPNFYNDGSVQLHAHAWYASPSDGTLARWIDDASAQADILTRAQSYYQLASDYAELASFNQDQLNTIIDVVQTRVNSAANAIDKKKWQAILDSLTATRDSQPAPVPAADLASYMADLVATARADMMLQADRAQAMLTMFDKAEAELNSVAALTASEIGRLRDGRKAKVASAKTGPVGKLRQALASMPALP